MHADRNARGAECRIELLADHLDALPLLVTWFEREWSPYYGPEGPGDARTDLLACVGREGLPVAFVALADGAVCGTAALKAASVTTHPHLTPWLAALLVDQPFRGQGVAGNLVGAVEDAARRGGFEWIYSGADPNRTLLARHGWELVETTPYFVSEVGIFRKAL